MIALTSYAPSRRPYALDLDSFTVDSRGKATVDAVWVTRKNGVTRVSSGFLWDFGPKTIDAFMRDFDARYGGECLARWDGESLWALGLSPQEHAEESARLAAVLTALPEVPDGYTGWYQINAPSGRR